MTLLVFLYDGSPISPSLSSLQSLKLRCSSMLLSSVHYPSPGRSLSLEALNLQGCHLLPLCKHPMAAVHFCPGNTAALTTLDVEGRLITPCYLVPTPFHLPMSEGPSP